MKTIVLATHNPHKRDELLQLLSSSGIALEVKTLDDFQPAIGDIPETGDTLEANALIKARAVFDRTGLPSLADDTGLMVDALGGAPGVYSARYAGENVTYADNVNKLLREMQGRQDRSARFGTVIAYVDEKGIEQLFEGAVEGTILDRPRGGAGFGYDPVFAPLEDEQGRTFAEMGSEEKNAISHRGRALRAFAKYLSSTTS